jgi:hypothetical protein
MHRVFVLSPEGPYLLKLLENVHRLLPYSMVKQTLRIGNAATMLNGMMRLLLAKIGVGALSNWVGLTQNADDGMNLLQRYEFALASRFDLTSAGSSGLCYHGMPPSFVRPLERLRRRKETPVLRESSLQQSGTTSTSRGKNMTALARPVRKILGPL